MANLGDSRTYLMRITQDKQGVEAIPMSTDHVASNKKELARVRSLSGNSGGALIDASLFNCFVQLSLSAAY